MGYHPLLGILRVLFTTAPAPSPSCDIKQSLIDRLFETYLPQLHFHMPVPMVPYTFANTLTAKLHALWNTHDMTSTFNAVFAPT